MSARCICTHFGKYFHNNVPTQINIPSWSHPSNHVRFYNISMVQMPYNMNPFGTTFPVLDWHDIMRMEYPLVMHWWNWHESWVVYPIAPTSTQPWLWISNMVLVGLMLQCWRRISIVSILFNVWHQNVNWTKEVFFCSPKLFMGILMQSTLVLGHVAACYWTNAPRSLTCVVR